MTRKHRISEAVSEINRARWAALTPEERSARMSALQRDRWARLTPEERSAEMRRRAAVRRENAGRPTETP